MYISLTTLGMIVGQDYEQMGRGKRNGDIIFIVVHVSSIAIPYTYTTNI